MWDKYPSYFPMYNFLRTCARVAHHTSTPFLLVSTRSRNSSRQRINKSTLTRLQLSTTTVRVLSLCRKIRFTTTLQAYRRSISIGLGLHHFREDRPSEDIYSTQCRRWNDQVVFGGSIPIPLALDGRNTKSS